jgi:hypothetical protein
MLGKKKLQYYREKTGLPVVSAMVRGGTDGRVDLCLEGGVVAFLFRSGEIEIDSKRRWVSWDEILARQ